MRALNLLSAIRALINLAILAAELPYGDCLISARCSALGLVYVTRSPRFLKNLLNYARRSVDAPFRAVITFSPRLLDDTKVANSYSVTSVACGRALRVSALLADFATFIYASLSYIFESTSLTAYVYRALGSVHSVSIAFPFGASPTFNRTACYGG